jgi:hypothetical protein
MRGAEEERSSAATDAGEDEEKRERSVGLMAGLMDKAKGFVVEKVMQIPKPEAALDHVSFRSISREGVELHSHVDISNPYSHRIPICEITYTFKSAGKYVILMHAPLPIWPHSGSISYHT